MNHNFLPFEVTELLPKENPYNKEDYFVWVTLNDQIFTHLASDVYFQEYLRDAWTIIDALTWLEEQGYFVQVFILEKNKHTFEILNSEGIDIRNYDPDYDSVQDELFNSRTEAYIAGIKHCLNLIKNEIPT